MQLKGTKKEQAGNLAYVAYTHFPLFKAPRQKQNIIMKQILKKKLSDIFPPQCKTKCKPLK